MDDFPLDIGPSSLTSNNLWVHIKDLVALSIGDLRYFLGLAGFPASLFRGEAGNRQPLLSGDRYFAVPMPIMTSLIYHQALGGDRERGRAA